MSPQLLCVPDTDNFKLDQSLFECCEALEKLLKEYCGSCASNPGHVAQVLGDLESEYKGFVAAIQHLS